MFSIALVGECMVELSADSHSDQLQQRFGGDTLNCAVYLRRLLSASQAGVSYVTALGTDNFSQKMIEQWCQQGIDTSLIRRLQDRLPGVYFIQLDEHGEREFLYWRNDSAATRCFDGNEAGQLLTTLSEYDYLYISGISVAILTSQGRERLLGLLHQAKDNGARVLFDNNYRPSLWENVDVARSVYNKIYQYTDIALLTWEDEQQLFAYSSQQRLFDDPAKQAITEIVLKRGALPCQIRVDSGIVEVPAVVVDHVVDTTAAGDSFNAGYLACRLLGASPELAARWGHRLASQVIQHQGAIIDETYMPVMPSLPGISGVPGEHTDA